MIGEAAKRHPQVAREIVARGHEASKPWADLELAVRDVATAGT